jgi:hypothetical protein
MERRIARLEAVVRADVLHELATLAASQHNLDVALVLTEARRILQLMQGRSVSLDEVVAEIGVDLAEVEDDARHLLARAGMWTRR